MDGWREGGVKGREEVKEDKGKREGGQKPDVGERKEIEKEGKSKAGERKCREQEGEEG